MKASGRKSSTKSKFYDEAKLVVTEGGSNGLSSASTPPSVVSFRFLADAVSSLEVGEYSFHVMYTETRQEILHDSIGGGGGGGGSGGGASKRKRGGQRQGAAEPLEAPVLKLTVSTGAPASITCAKAGKQNKKGRGGRGGGGQASLEGMTASDSPDDDKHRLLTTNVHMQFEDRFQNPVTFDHDPEDGAGWRLRCTIIDADDGMEKF